MALRVRGGGSDGGGGFGYAADGWCWRQRQQQQQQKQQQQQQRQQRRLQGERGSGWGASRTPVALTQDEHALTTVSTTQHADSSARREPGAAAAEAEAETGAGGAAGGNVSLTALLSDLETPRGVGTSAPAAGRPHTPAASMTDNSSGAATADHSSVSVRATSATGLDLISCLVDG